MQPSVSHVALFTISHIMEEQHVVIHPIIITVELAKLLHWLDDIIHISLVSISNVSK